MKYDAIVIGGSYAGMAAALQLLRAHKMVLVIDAGLRRNRFASRSHGFLGQDRVEPAEIVRVSRRQLEAYPTLTWVEGEATELAGTRDDFEVEMASGAVYHGRRILFATGLKDLLPKIEGITERWGRSVFHCPYCHGYELGQGRVGVIATGAFSTHQAELLTEWGETTYFVNGAFPLDAAQRHTLETRGVRIEETPIERVEADADVRLVDGRVLPFAGLFIAPQTEPSSPLPAASGCALTAAMTGTQIQTDETKETSVRGVFAAGDAAQAMHSVTLAVNDGALAGVHLHRSLIWPDPVN